MTDPAAGMIYMHGGGYVFGNLSNLAYIVLVKAYMY